MKSSLVILLLSAFAFRAFAETEAGLQSRLQSLNYLGDLSSQVEPNLFQLEIEPYAVWKPLRWFRLRGGGFFQFDPRNKSESEQRFFDVSEFYFEIKRKAISLRVGQQVFQWGITEGYNPLDVLSPRRMNDPLAAKKLGILATALNLDFGDARVDLIWVPRNRKSIPPGDQSVWLPRDQLLSQQTDEATLLFDENFTYKYRTESELSGALAHNYGGKAEASFLGLDMMMVYFEGSSNNPLIEPVETVGTLISTVNGRQIIDAESVTLQTTYYRVQAMGGGVVLPAWGNLFKWAYIKTKPMRKEIAESEEKSDMVAAIERPFTFGDQSLNLMLMATLGDYSGEDGNSASAVSRIFEKSFVLGLQWLPNEDWSWLISGLVDTLRPQSVFQTELTHRFHDHFKVYLKSVILSAKDDAPLKSYDKNDNILFGVQGSW